jgi:MFS family permease
VLIAIGRTDSLTPYAIGLALAGLGTGLFQTPNTAALMKDVNPDRRGTANGVRSMLQNVAGVIGTALALLLVTAGLAPSIRRVVYGASPGTTTAGDQRALEAGFQLSFGMLLVAALAAIALSASRGKRVVVEPPSAEEANISTDRPTTRSDADDQLVPANTGDTNAPHERRSDK